MSVRILSKELQNVALCQLNEKPKKINDDLQYIREWISKQPHLKVKTDDQWLLTMLRCCKFRLEQTKKRIDLLLTMKTIAPEFFLNRDPFLPEIQDLLSSGCVLPLPKAEDPTAPRTILIRMLERNAKHKVSDGLKLILMTFEILMNEDDNFIVSGSQVLEDYKELSTKHIQMVSPTVIKNGITCLLFTYPLRANSFHIINASNIFTNALNIAKPFLSEKILSKVHIHKNEKDVINVISKSVLPYEYGGTGGNLDDLISKWKCKVESYRDWFLEDYEYKSDESKRLGGTPVTYEHILGIDGSFRQLNID